MIIPKSLYTIKHKLMSKMKQEQSLNPDQVAIKEVIY